MVLLSLFTLNAYAQNISIADFCVLDSARLATQIANASLEKLHREYQYFGNERGFVIEKLFVFNTNLTYQNQGRSGDLHVGLYDFANYPQPLIDITDMSENCDDSTLGIYNLCIATMFVEKSREFICN
jgi:hypothetical protein